MIKQHTLRLGASSIADLCGYGFNSIQQLWRIKTGREERPPMNAAMAHGKENESRAIIATECDLGRIWGHTSDDRDKQKLFSTGWKGAQLVAYVDGWDASAKQALEVKCPMKLKDEIPTKYLIQMQFTMFLGQGEIESFVYSEWQPSNSRHWVVWPSEEFQGIAMQHVNRFIEYVEQDKTPPRWTGKKNPKPQFPYVETERIG